MKIYYTQGIRIIERSEKGERDVTLNFGPYYLKLVEEKINDLPNSPLHQELALLKINRERGLGSLN